MGMRAVWLRLRANFRRTAAEQELDEEIRFHIEQEAAKLERAGALPDEARRRALASFGGVERTKEDYRDHRGDRPLADLRADLGFAARLLRRNPTLAFTVICTLALGMGSVVAIFSAVSAVILRPLPFAQSQRLVALWEDNDDKGWKGQAAAPANMIDWQDRVRAFEGVEAWTDFAEEAVVNGAGEPFVLRGYAVTGGFFDLLGVRPALGGTFQKSATWGPAEAGVVLSHRAWRDKFGADPGLIGRSIRIDGRDTRILGVMPERFALPDERAEMWRPTQWNPTDRAQTWFRRAHFMRPFARLKDGVTLEQARTELVTVMSALERENPEINKRMEADLGTLHEYLVGSTRRPLLILLAATGLLLLIACANVGNLLLVRAEAREREVVLRRALGAGWGRIVRQALTESALLSLLGGAFGLAIGWWGTRALVAWQPANLLPIRDVQPDLRVFAAVFVLSMACAALFGTAPALWSARRPAADALKEGVRGSSTGRRARWWVHGLAAGEVALAVMLTVAAGLFLRSYQRLTAVDPGFSTERTLVMTLTLPSIQNGAPQAMNAFYDVLLPRLRAVPGVKDAAISSSMPLRNGLTMALSIRGRGAEGKAQEVLHHRITGDYFKALGVPLLAGRTFEDSDDLTGEPVIMINEALAAQFFKGRDPLGQYIANDLEPDSTSRWARIIGVVGNERQFALGTPPRIEIFDPMRQSPRAGFHVVMNTSVEPSALFRPLSQAIASIDPALPVVSIQTVDSLVSGSLARERFMAMLLAAFAVVGALLALVGVYGVVAQAALRRVPEMGIRMALGADPAHVRWMIVRHGLMLTGAGAGIGAVAALLAGGAVRQMLFEVSHRDIATFGVVIGAILVTGVLASFVPALRVTRHPAASVLGR